MDGLAHWRRLTAIALAGLVAASLVGNLAEAQNPKTPKPREITLHTGDGVEIAAVYYGSDRGKEAIPVILLHEYGGSGADFKVLAETLQSQGFAVLLPDLRGHGGSTKVKGGKDLDHKKMLPKVCHAMYGKDGDIDVCKAFLIKENNQEKLNIDKLCIVGAGLGGSLGVNWAILDWAWPIVGGVRQGQDVKAIAMLSPPYSEKSVTLTNALRSSVVLKDLSIYIAVGGTGKQVDDAKKITKPIEVARGVSEGADVKKGLLLQVFDKTNRQGTQMLALADLQIAERIKQFFDATIGKRDLPWKERKSPFD